MIGKFKEKVDDALAARLVSAGPKEELTVIFEIAQRPGEDSYDHDVPDENVSLDEAEHARVVDQLEKAASDVNRTVIDSLAELGLKTRGGRYAPVLIVTGKPDAMRRALALDAVSSATLDDSLDLIAPEIPEDENKR